LIQFDVKYIGLGIQIPHLCKLIITIFGLLNKKGRKAQILCIEKRGIAKTHSGRASGFSLRYLELNTRILHDEV